MRNEFAEAIGKDQSGFTLELSCADNLFTLQEINVQRTKRDQYLHINFIDLKKTYNNVSKNLIKIVAEL